MRRRWAFACATAGALLSVSVAGVWGSACSSFTAAPAPDTGINGVDASDASLPSLEGGDAPNNPNGCPNGALLCSDFDQSDDPTFGGWEKIRPINADIKIDKTQFRSKPASARFKIESADFINAHLVKSLGALTSVTMTFDVLLHEDAAGWTQKESIVIGYVVFGPSCALAPSIGPTAQGVHLEDDRTTGDGTSHESLGRTPADKWTNLSLSVNHTAKTFTFTIDGVRELSDVPIPPACYNGVFEKTLTEVSVGPHYLKHADAFIDNVVITGQ